MTKEQLWQAVLGELELSLSKVHFTTWFKNTFISSVEEGDGKVVIGVPNTFTHAWLEKKYHKAILEALRNITDGKIDRADYRVENKSLEDRKCSSKDGAVIDFDSGSEKTAASQDFGEGARDNKFGLNPRYTFTSFVVGKGNELAHAACQAVSNFIGTKYNPLFLYGGVGLGKTHLIQAIGHEILSKWPDKKILYVNAEKFTNEYIQAIRTGKMKKFKSNYRDPDVLLVDDIQFISGKERTQEEFFHTFNDLHQKNSQIVFTSDRPPHAIPALEERLTSRFQWGMIADVSSPDLETRIAILESKMEEKKYRLDRELVRCVAANIQKNVRELEGALNKIIAYHELYNIVPTAETVKSVLASLTSSCQKTAVTPKQLIGTVAGFYDLKISDLLGNSRRKELVIPRQITMYLLRKELDYSYPTIGQEVGSRDHTTAMYAYNKICKEVDNEGRIEQEIESIKQRLYN